MRWVLGYLKKLVEKLKEDPKNDVEFIKAFQNKVRGYFSKVIGPNFKDYDFYTGESMDADGMYETSELDHLVIRFTQRWLTYVLQGRSSELPRGWCNAIYYSLERWFEGSQSLDAGH